MDFTSAVLDFSILAGLYAREDIIEGTQRAATIVAILCTPFLFFRRKKPAVARVAASLIVYGCTIYGIVVLGLFAAYCPPYWERALSALLIVPIVSIGVLRWYRERKIRGELLGYAAAAACLGFLFGVRWIEDVESVTSGRAPTRAEMQERKDAQSTQSP